jgi:hypothetical protein
VASTKVGFGGITLQGDRPMNTRTTGAATTAHVQDDIFCKVPAGIYSQHVLPF